MRILKKISKALESEIKEWKGDSMIPLWFFLRNFQYVFFLKLFKKS